MAKQVAYRRGAAVSATVYSDQAHREASIEKAKKMSPFMEEVSSDGDSIEVTGGLQPYGLVVYNPMRVEAEPKEFQPGDVPEAKWSPVAV